MLNIVLLLCGFILPIVLATRKDAHLSNFDSNRTNAIKLCPEQLFHGYPMSPFNTVAELGLCRDGFIPAEYISINCSKIESKRDHDTLERIQANKAHRRRYLANKLANVQKVHGTILVTSCTRDYVFMLLNMLCSIAANIGKEFMSRIQRGMLVLTDDAATSNVLKTMGFNVIESSYVGAGTNDHDLQSETTLSTRVSKVKGILWLLVSDILHLGHDLLCLDTDVIWRRSPLSSLLPRAVQGLDFLLSFDGRYKTSDKLDLEGPINSGIVFARSTCRSRVAMETAANLADIPSILGFTDQAIVNLVFHHAPAFRFLRLGLFPSNLFVNGNIHHVPALRNAIDWTKIYMIHASWCYGLKEKLVKLRSTQDYYFNGTCVLYRKDLDTPLLNGF